MSIQLTKEKSEQQAEAIILICAFVHGLDTEYCKELIKAMNNQISMEQTLSVLNPSYSPKKNSILRVQAHALDFLVKYVEALKEIEKMKLELANEESHYEQVKKMFL